MTDIWLQTVRPFLAAVLMPPFPFICLFGAAFWMTGKRAGRLLAVGAAVAGMWLSACIGTARFLQPMLVVVPQAMTETRIAELEREAQSGARRTALIVLGSGIQQNAPEYRDSKLSGVSLERLRYGIWLSRKMATPVGFSGGVGWAGEPGKSEAETAQRVATEEFLYPLKWVEPASRDTLENAANTTALLHKSGIQHIVVVTSGLHMQRSLRAFARATKGTGMTVEPAPIDTAMRVDKSIYDWIPSPHGYGTVYVLLREWLGWLAGA
ncbi:YdcF family protein [Ottowia sp.]|uniref:YdcF family protein n=1 Tax=Ottowia sp. TaxID=1898956 RepID=UPI0025FE1BA7|nr:YdcF family protein [Ottowia sp.]MBK6616191.1 YdcF family protein [Ottowia sp.]